MALGIFLLQYLGNAVDILVVWYVIYKLMMVIRGTKAVQLLKELSSLFSSGWEVRISVLTHFNG